MCLLIAVLGLSGTLLVFKNDYVRAAIPQARETVATDPVSLAKTIVKIEQNYASSEIKFVNLAGDHSGLHLIGLKDDSSAFADGRGIILSTWKKNGRVEDWIFDLHRHLLNGDTGELVAGFAALAAALMCITGLVLWWPTLRVFSLRIVPKTLKRSDLVSSHRNLGAIMALPVIFLSLTGATFAFPDQTKWVLAKTLPSQALPKPPRVGVAVGDVDWHQALSRAQQAYPDATLRLIIWPKKPNEPISIRLRQPREWNPNGRTIVWIDPATSQIAGTLDALKLKPAQAAYNLIYPLHAAKLGDRMVGRFVDALTALTGLSLAALGLIGAFSFLRSLRTPKKRVMQPQQA